MPQGLILHGDDQHLIFPLGSTVVVKNIVANTLRFLQDDSHEAAAISCMALSPSGKYLAAGQLTHIGFPVRRLGRAWTAAGGSCMRSWAHMLTVDGRRW